MVMHEVGVGQWRAIATDANMASLLRHLVACSHDGNAYATWLCDCLSQDATPADQWDRVHDLLTSMRQPGIGQAGSSLIELRALVVDWADKQGL